MMEEKNIIHGFPPVVPLSQDSFGKQLYDSFLKNKKLPSALVDAVTGQNLSHQEIFNKSRSLALNLQKYGITQNDVVAVYSENNLDYACPIIAAMYLGVTATTINPNYNSRELLHCTSISKPVIIFCSKATLKVASEASNQMQYLKKIVVIDTKEKLDGLDSISDLTLGYPEEELKNFNPVTINPSEHVALILYSSGTTGLSKGVLLTHRNLNVAAAAYRDSRFCEQFEPGTSISLGLLPFYHVFGLAVMLTGLLLGKQTIVIKKFEAALFLQSIQDYRIRELWLVPPLINFLGTSPLIDEYDLSSVEMIFYGGAPTNLDIVKKVKQRLKLKMVIQGYGLTETVAAILFPPIGENKAGACGKLFPHASAKVINPDSGISLGPKQNGELCFKGYQIMKGYAGNVKATKEAIDENGWFHTGDIGYYDEDGSFFVIDRLKELIKYNCFQVAPAELEALLLTHPEIQDVGVVGLPNEAAGELPLAFVVRKPNSSVSEEEIKNFLASKVSPQKQLRGGVRFINEIPRNLSGKILRRKLRELL